MRNWPIIVIVLLAYLGFEAYAIKRAGHRTKPQYIHALLAKAESAAELCQLVDPGLRERFTRTLDRTIKRYRVVLAEENPELSTDAVDTLIAERAQLARNAVEAEWSGSDCTSQLMKDHLRRYEIYAKKSR